MQMRRNLGSLPAVTLRGNQPDYRPIATATRRRATPHRPTSERASAPRISTHTDLEPRAKQPDITKPNRRSRAAKYTPRMSTSLCVVNTISNQQGGTANACESEVKTSLDFIQPPWTAEKSPVKARRATPRNVSIPPKRRYMRRHSCFAGVQLLGAAPFSTPFTVEYGKTPLTLWLW